MAETDETWRCWVQLTFQDAMAYIGLFLGIRSGDWDLRMAAPKQMAPIFSAFDHPNYQKLKGRHIRCAVIGAKHASTGGICG